MDDTRLDYLKKRYNSTMDKHIKAKMMLRQLYGATKESDDEDEELEESEKSTLTRTLSEGD